MQATVIQERRYMMKTQKVLEKNYWGLAGEKSKIHNPYSDLFYWNAINSQ